MWCHQKGNRIFFALLTIVAFILSKGLVFSPDHWMICWRRMGKHRQKHLASLRHHSVTLDYSLLRSYVRMSLTSHLSQVQNESISVIKTLPGNGNLCCSDSTSPFDVQQPFDVRIIGHNVFEPWSHAPFLWRKLVMLLRSKSEKSTAGSQQPVCIGHTWLSLPCTWAHIWSIHKRQWTRDPGLRGTGPEAHSGSCLAGL